MKKIILTLFLLGLYFLSLSQGEGTQEVTNSTLSPTTNRAFFRWVFQPKYFPYIPILNRQFDKNDNQISIDNDRGFFVGGRMEKYFPNHPKGYGIEMDILFKEIVFRNGSDFFINEKAVAITPFYSLKKRKSNSILAEKINHPFLELGIRNQFSFSNSIQFYNDAQSISDGKNNILRKFKMWAYVGLGTKKDLVNQSSYRAGMSSLSLGLYIPFFQQASIFKTKKANFPDELELFSKNRSWNAFLTLTYTQTLDIHKNEIFKYFPIPIEYINQDNGKTEWSYPKNKKQKFLPPLINFNAPRYAIFGNFYLSSERQNGTDSVFVDINQDTFIYDLSPSLLNSFRFGYTLHFLGNYKDFVNDLGTGEVYFQNDSGIRWNLFGSAGLMSRQYNLNAPDQLARIYYIDAEFSGGARIGLNSIGLFFIGGYTQAFHLNKKLQLNGISTDNFNFSNLKNSSIFLGIGFKNLFYVKVNMYNMEKVELLERVPHKNFIISFGFGF